MALIEYIGKQKNRQDDVLKTARVWKAAGDVIEVPDDQKHYYLLHPMEWRETTASEVDKREKARNSAAKNLKEIKDEWGKLTVADLEGIRDDITAEIIARKAAATKTQAPSAAAKASVASAPQLHTGSDDVSKQASANRLLQIREAVKSLDPNDPEHYTGEPNKRPRVDAVSEAVGFKVSKDEIEQAQTLGLDKAA